MILLNIFQHYIIYFVVSYFLVTLKLFRLRLVLIFISLILLYYGNSIGNYRLVTWNFVFILLNIILYTKEFRKRSFAKIDEKFLDIYNNIFSEISKFEFMLFWNSGTLLSSLKGEFLCKNGVVQGDIFLILEGTASVFKNGEKKCELHRGDFAAERGYITNSPASADVTAETNISYIKWLREDLEQLKISDSKLFTQIEKILSNNYSH